MKEKKEKKGGREGGERRDDTYPTTEISLFNYTVINTSAQTASFRILRGKLSELWQQPHPRQMRLL